MEDCITKDEAIEMLQNEVPMKSKREVHIRMSGFPAYTTQVGWLGYSDEKIRTLRYRPCLYRIILTIKFTCQIFLVLFTSEFFY